MAIFFTNEHKLFRFINDPPIFGLYFCCWFCCFSCVCLPLIIKPAKYCQSANCIADKANFPIHTYIYSREFVCWLRKSYRTSTMKSFMPYVFLCCYCLNNCKQIVQFKVAHCTPLVYRTQSAYTHRVRVDSVAYVKLHFDHKPNLRSKMLTIIGPIYGGR